MRSFSVIPEEPRDELAIEPIRSHEQLVVMVDKFFLNRSVKPFHVGVHLGRFRSLARCGSLGRAKLVR